MFYLLIVWFFFFALGSTCSDQLSLDSKVLIFLFHCCALAPLKSPILLIIELPAQYSDPTLVTGIMAT